MASKKTHQRNLERARENRGGAPTRTGGAAASGMDRNRIIALALIVVLAGAVLVGALASRGGDDPADSFAFDEAQDQAQDDGLVDEAAPDASETLPAEASACDLGVDAPAPTEAQYDAPPEMIIDPAAAYRATIETTCGTIDVELFAADSPLAVNNFVFLANEGFYAGVPFHRVIDGFMIQGGDPTGTGGGGPGYRFEDELDFTTQYVEDNGGYTVGTLAMANAGPDTNGSQFFIMDGDTGLPPAYVVFGRTTAGQDVVDAISQVPVQGDQAIDPVRIVGVTVTEA